MSEIDDTTAPTPSRTSREVWSPVDTAAIAQHPEGFKTCPTKSTIRKLSEDSKELYEIMVREGFSRCYEKVKNLMKKRRRDEH